MRLKEWLDANGKKVSTTSTAPQIAGTSGQITSGSFKKRLDKLITYYGQHLPAGIDYLNITLLTPDTLVFTEHYDTGSKAVCRIYISPTTEAWNFKVSVDSKPTDNLSGEGWTDLLKTLRAYITVPVTGTPEYKGLLTEWVDKSGKKVSLATSTAARPASNSPPNYPSQEYRYKRLLAQIDSDKICKYTINLLDDRILAITLNNGVGVKIIFKPYVPCYLVQVDGYDTTCDDYEDVLKLLIIEGIIRDTDLCEAASYAEDFKLYENLWD